MHIFVRDYYLVVAGRVEEFGPLAMTLFWSENGENFKVDFSSESLIGLTMHK